ncbi:MAG: radical SAM protein [Oligoflexales bacterium]
MTITCDISEQSINTAIKQKNLKVSYYTIDVHLGDHEIDKVLLFSPVTGKLQSIDPDLWTQISKGNLSNLTQNELDLLIKSKIIVEEHSNSLQEVTEENEDFVEQSKIFKLVVQPTAACPLGCGYCGQDHSSKHMSETNQKKLIEFAKKSIKSGKFKAMNIGWFGAEPLASFKTLEDISTQLQGLARDSELRYFSNIVTNGILLSRQRFQKLVNEHNIKSFEITLDGLEEQHNVRRPLKSGQNSFKRIYKNLIEIAEVKPNDVSITIRCNVDGSNKDSIPKLLQKMKDDGLHEKVSVYFAPIHSWGNDAHKQSAEKQAFAEWEIEWFCLMINLGFKLSLLPGRKKQVCLAVNKNNFLIDPFGGVYGCTEVSLVPSYHKNGKNIHEFGKLGEQNITGNPERNIFGSYNTKIQNKSTPCSTCQVLPVCGGHCPKAWIEGKEIPCPSFKYNIRERMLLSYLLKINKGKQD